MVIFKILQEIENQTQSRIYLTGEYVYRFLIDDKKRKIDDIIIIGISSKIIKCLNKHGVYSKTKKIFLYNSIKINITIINPLKNKTDNELLKINSTKRLFTIYSIYLPINNMKKIKIIDFVNGKKDIKKQQINIIGDVEKKLKINRLLIIQAITISILFNYSLNKKIINFQNMICVKELSKKKILLLKDCLITIITSTTPSKHFKLLKKLNLLKIIFPELYNCINLKQDTKYHKYDVFNHCIYTCDHIENNLVLRLAAVFHDVGKASTIKKINKKITFHKHEVISANIVKHRLKVLGFDQELINKVYLLVRLHMYHYTREYTDTGIRRFIKKSGLTKKDIDDIANFSLFKLRIADRLGNGIKTIPITERQKDFEKRIIKVYNKMHSLTFKDLNITKLFIYKCFNTSFTNDTTTNIIKFLLEKIKTNPEKNKEKILIKLIIDYLYKINYWN